MGFTGVIHSFPDSLRGEWVIGEYHVMVSAETEIDGTPEVGLEADVEAVRAEDGTLHATTIEIQESDPDETPEPDEVGFSGVIHGFPAGLLGEWVIGEYHVMVSAETEIDGTPEVGLEADVEAVRAEDGTLHATAIEIQESDPDETPEPTPTPRPSETPRPTQTPRPSATPTPQEVHFSGVIRSFPAGRIGDWVIGAYRVQVTARTEIDGTPQVGAQADVEAWRYPDGRLVATGISIEEQEEETASRTGLKSPPAAKKAPQARP